MEQLFILIIYQPFLNILVSFYWVLTQIPGATADMGVAVILMSLVIRIILLPLSFASDRSEHERHAIEKRAKEIQKQYATDPVRMNKELKLIMRANPRILIAEFVDLAISVIITLLLIRIFSSGLEGGDLHYLYPWAPHPPTPYNLVFLGKFDLSKPNLVLNIVQSLVILLTEIVSEFTSPFRGIMSAAEENLQTEYNPISPGRSSYQLETRTRVRSLQVALPLVSFFIFLFLPAGKKLFIITTLLFSVGFMLIRWGHWKINDMFGKREEEVEEPIEVVSPPAAT